MPAVLAPNETDLAEGAEAPPVPAHAVGRTLEYPDDEWLAEPEVYYNPQDMNGRFRSYLNREQHLIFQHLRFENGRFIARTRIEREAVRRALGQNADRWQGDDMSRELVCSNRACRFPTRNGNAWDDHMAFTEHDRPYVPQPYG